MRERTNATDRAIIRATQAGLPLVARPYHALADALGVSAETVMARLKAMLDDGIIRRIGAVPNHYALGLAHNAMTVWDVEEAALGDLGRRVGALPFVTHAYHRPRSPSASSRKRASGSRPEPTGATTCSVSRSS